MPEIDFPVGTYSIRSKSEHKLEFTFEKNEHIDIYKDYLEKCIKLKNELERTHEFYNESGNGTCAGVTHQILALSNYGGNEKNET